MVQLRVTKSLKALVAAVDQVDLAALVPPPMPRLPRFKLNVVAAVLMLTKMFSIDWAVRAQLVQASI